jgi:hypothetical protein
MCMSLRICVCIYTKTRRVFFTFCVHLLESCARTVSTHELQDVCTRIHDSHAQPQAIYEEDAGVSKVAQTLGDSNLGGDESEVLDDAEKFDRMEVRHACILARTCAFSGCVETSVHTAACCLCALDSLRCYLYCCTLSGCVLHKSNAYDARMSQAYALDAYPRLVPRLSIKHAIRHADICVCIFCLCAPTRTYHTLTDMRVTHTHAGGARHDRGPRLSRVPQRRQECVPQDKCGTKGQNKACEYVKYRTGYTRVFCILFVCESLRHKTSNVSSYFKPA